MLHTYAYCDAAKVFVFLGGYASAAAYVRLTSRKGELAARRHFLKRAITIYLAYLLTAALMLICSAGLALMPSPPADLDKVWSLFAVNPMRTLADIALFRHQPFLSAVLPMYVIFAFFVPYTVPLARNSPSGVLVMSLALWLAAPWLGAELPSASGESWPFNPFAWQLMFTFGTLCRLHPVSPAAQASAWGRHLTSAAFGVALTFAFIKLDVDVHPASGYMKQNLASVRVFSFLSIAWLCAQTVRLGWIRELAVRLPAIVTVGRQGLICFVGGTVISVLAGAGLHIARANASKLLTDWPTRLTFRRSWTQFDVNFVAGLAGETRLRPAG
jgi:hypothetical protein